MTNFLLFTIPTAETIDTNCESILFTLVVLMLVAGVTLRIAIDNHNK